MFSTYKQRHPIGTPFRVPNAPLLIHLPANAQGNATEDGLLQPVQHKPGSEQRKDRVEKTLKVACCRTHLMIRIKSSADRLNIPFEMVEELRKLK